MSKRQYKLVKCYPGSPYLDTIATLEDPYYRYDGSCLVFKNMIENFPEYWEPIKEPIFTTEDGVSINCGDTYWYAWFSGDVESIQQKLYTAYSFVARESPGSFIDSKTFSTKEKANAWIEENKPQYSKKDLKIISNNFLDNYIKYGNHSFIDFDKWLKNIKK